MKLTCEACKLTLNARDEDRGKTFACPICRGPLREADAPAAAVEEKKPKPATLEWSGGSLDDLLYMVNSQALAAVIEVCASDRSKRGEVHVIAGGVDEAYVGESRGDDALEALRREVEAIYRVELRLPNDTGSMASSNPDRGDLKSRSLAKLMRYCEDYVLTCDLEAWRGNETCRVEYRRGNISRTLINGIDAPEQLAEVMSWTSGNYRFVLPRLALPKELDQAARAQAKAAAETRISEQRQARKTIYGMPAAAMMPGLAAAAAAQELPLNKTIMGVPGADIPAVKTVVGTPGMAAAPIDSAKTIMGMPGGTDMPAMKTMIGVPPAQGVPIDPAKTIMGMPASGAPAVDPGKTIIGVPPATDVARPTGASGSLESVTAKTIFSNVSAPSTPSAPAAPARTESRSEARTQPAKPKGVAAAAQAAGQSSPPPEETDKVARERTQKPRKAKNGDSQPSAQNERGAKGGVTQSKKRPAPPPVSRWQSTGIILGVAMLFLAVCYVVFYVFAK
jgi:hypothetical protein